MWQKSLVTQNEAMSNGTQVSIEARVAVLEEELETVRFLAAKGVDDERKAAASLRVLELTQEIERLRAA